MESHSAILQPLLIPILGMAPLLMLFILKDNKKYPLRKQ